MRISWMRWISVAILKNIGFSQANATGLSRWHWLSGNSRHLLYQCNAHDSRRVRYDTERQVRIDHHDTFFILLKSMLTSSSLTKCDHYIRIVFHWHQNILFICAVNKVRSIYHTFHMHI